MTAPSPQPTKQKEETLLIDKPRFVLATIFLFAGALGIPMIWVCRGFNTRQKIFWTIAAFLYTLAMLGVLGWVLVYYYNQLKQAMDHSQPF